MSALRSNLPLLNLPRVSSFVLAGLVCLMALIYGLLPGLLAVCLGYIGAHALSSAAPGKRPLLSPEWAATVVILVPILGLGIFLSHAKGLVLGAADQYQAMMHHLATTVLEIREKLPPTLAEHLPAEMLSIQTLMAEHLKAKAGALTGIGKVWLHGSLLVYVGLVVGALIVGSRPLPTKAPLGYEIRLRANRFIDAFRQIVIAQFWIAGFNALCTTLFLLVALPLFGVKMPYVAALVTLTFFAGLIPIVGNLLCNGVLTLAGLSVSPMVGLACLGFLVAIHKFEYFINAKAVGRSTRTAAWELLAVIFAGEAIFGVLGLVAAPLFYAFVKKELQAAKLV